MVNSSRDVDCHARERCAGSAPVGDAGVVFNVLAQVFGIGYPAAKYHPVCQQRAYLWAPARIIWAPEAKQNFAPVFGLGFAHIL